eukprot:maker-scaffold_7-snap-gene-7.34-mRNA-1 protein AED:0.04 eAED:0.06 QI:0/0/0.5/1/0/0/2/551/322
MSSYLILSLQCYLDSSVIWLLFVLMTKIVGSMNKQNLEDSKKRELSVQEGFEIDGIKVHQVITTISNDFSNIPLSKNSSDFPVPFEISSVSYRLDPTSGWYYHEKGFYYNFNEKIYFWKVKNKHYKYNPDLKKFVKVAYKRVEENICKKRRKSTPSTSPENKLDISIDLSSLNPVDEKPIQKISSEKTNIKADVSVVKDQLLEQKAICFLCRRRFKSYSKLLRHERLSEMHKKNLEKKREQNNGILPISLAEPKSVEEATAASVAAGYIDRAGKRRKIFQETLKEEHQKDNKGKNILKKFGWREGKGLGANEQGDLEPIGKL